MSPSPLSALLVEAPGGAAALLAMEPPPAGVAFAWLGQAGFLFRTASHTIIVDPYLSDSLAEKYKGREFPHVRMMPPPLEPEAVRGVDAVLCTHRHTDHLDPGTLPIIATNNPDCLFVAPRSIMDTAEAMGLPAARLVPVVAGTRTRLVDALEVVSFPAAHEELEVNERGEHLFLGYLIQFGDVSIYHSGDTIPYDGLAERLAAHPIDVAFLPVNGRDAFRRERGVPGNMNIDEALDLCARAGIPRMVAGHFGMFAFNTVAPAELHERIGRHGSSVACIVPAVDRHWTLTPAPPANPAAE